MERSSSAVKRRDPKRWASTPFPGVWICCSLFLTAFAVLNEQSHCSPLALCSDCGLKTTLFSDSGIFHARLLLNWSYLFSSIFLKNHKAVFHLLKLDVAIINPLVRLQGYQDFLLSTLPKVRETHRMSTIEAARQPSSRHLGSICSEM